MKVCLSFRILYRDADICAFVNVVCGRSVLFSLDWCKIQSDTIVGENAMNKRVMKGILIGIAIILVPILLFVGVMLTRVNRAQWDYAYNTELPKPGIGVDLNHDDIFTDLYIRWCNLVNGIQSSQWKAPEGITKLPLSVTARDGATIGGYVLVPSGCEDETLPTMLYCHGGGFFLSLMSCQLDLAAVYTEELHCRVVLPEYRTALDHPYPVPVQDCFDTLKFIASDSKTDTDRVLIYGDSAGGCLAASVTQMCCEEQLLKPAAQMLIYPVTDTAQDYPSLISYEHATWSREANVRMWKVYLGGKKPTENDYAIPMLHSSCAGLPQAWVETAEMDTLCDQGAAYANKMMSDGVPVTLRNVEGAYHGYDGSVGNSFVRRMLDERIEWLRTVLEKAQ